MIIKNIKAIIYGFLFIIVSLLLFQLVYIFLVTFYNHFSEFHPYLLEISLILKALIIIPSLLIIMFAGGYFTAVINHRRILLNSFIVGLLITGGAMWLMLSNTELSIIGLIVNGLMLISTVLGGQYRERKIRRFDDYEMG